MSLCPTTAKLHAEDHYSAVTAYTLKQRTHTHTHLSCPVLLSRCLRGHANPHKGRNEGKVVVISFSCSICGQSVLPCYGTTAPPHTHTLVLVLVLPLPELATWPLRI